MSENESRDDLYHDKRHYTINSTLAISAVQNRYKCGNEIQVWLFNPLRQVTPCFVESVQSMMTERMNFFFFREFTHSPEKMEAMAAIMNEMTTPGPATLRATIPATRYIPVPTQEPTPKDVRSRVVRHFCK